MEHVIPRSFGCPNSLQINCVCEECNSFFGRTIDRVLAYDSRESVLRLELLKSGRRNKSRFLVKQSRVSQRIPLERKFGDFAGLYVEPIAGPKLSIHLLPQIKLIGSMGEIELIKIADISRFNYLYFRSKVKTFKEAGSVTVYAGSEVEMRIAQRKLEKYGIMKNFKDFTLIMNNNLLEDGKLIVYIEGQVSTEIYRAYGKIALNYAALKYGPGFVLQSQFDNIREFVLTDNIPNQSVSFSDKGKYPEDLVNKHAISIVTEGTSIYAYASLFAQTGFIYKILLSSWSVIPSVSASSIVVDPIKKEIQQQSGNILFINR